MLTDGQTHRRTDMTKLKFSFRNFVHAPRSGNETKQIEMKGVCCEKEDQERKKERKKRNSTVNSSRHQQKKIPF